MKIDLPQTLSWKKWLKAAGILAACTGWLLIVIWSWRRGLSFTISVVKLPGSLFSSSGKLYPRQALSCLPFT